MSRRNAQKQRLAALQLANAKRTALKEIKASIDGYEAAIDVVLKSDAGLPTFALLTSIPRVGPRKANEILRTARITDRTQIGGEQDRTRFRPLTPRERFALAGELRGRA